MSTIDLTISGNPTNSESIITVSELNLTFSEYKTFIKNSFYFILLTDNNFNNDLFFILTETQIAIILKHLHSI